MRFAQIVVGPAGSGKSTYCHHMQQHGVDGKRNIQVVNLDPAAEIFNYTPMVDIRELIHLDDAMEDEELQYGPNGGLIFCLEFLLENQDWLKAKLCGGEDELMLGEPDDDYILFDMPGQLELFTHLKMDSQFMVDGAKFIGGTMAALSVMANMEQPHVNVLTKIDLLGNEARKQLELFLEPDTQNLVSQITIGSAFGMKYRKLTEAIGSLIEDFSLVRFTPLNPDDEESTSDLLLQIDNILQYGEDADVQVRDFDEFEPKDD